MSNVTPSEYAECAALVDWMDRHGLTYTHVPLGGLRQKRTAAILRRLGARAGCPDYLVFSEPPMAVAPRGIAIEMKRRRGGTLSPAQGRFVAELERCGWLVIVAYGAEQAVQELQRFGFGAGDGDGLQATTNGAHNGGGDAQT
jgi:hypothetical protein